MALTLLIAGIDRIEYLERGSLRINQDAATYVSTCYFTLIDKNNVVTAAIKDTLVVQDVALGEVYFDGTVANVDFDSLSGVGKRVKVQCQDNNILVEEAIVVGPHSYVAVADNVIIAALFALYCPAISTLPANVHGVDGAVTIDFQNITLREAMKQLCDRTGGFWFVREDDLYYGEEADFGLVGWFLSDTPDNLNSFGYLRDTARKYHGSNMVNEITVIGVLDAAGGITRQDLVSQGLYGVHAAITTDNRISTVAGGQKRGDAILADWSMPRESYTVKTWEGGAIAGQRIRYVNSVYGIDDTFTIRRLSISFPSDTALYTMSLGDDLDLGLLGQRIFLDKVDEALEPIEPMDLPLSSLGWSHNIVFTPTAFDLVTWAGAGVITAADGTTYNIGAGTTPNMGAATVYYIYLDLAISAIALQWNVNPANAVGADRLLVAVCYPSTDVTTDASVQVMAGSGGSAGVFINADNIAANCITAGLIFANTITAGCIAAGTITATEIAALTITGALIAADTITADKLQIGEMFFNVVEGLLLLGPHCEINTTEWISLRRQTATISGAFHQVAGRWIDTRALVIEEATANGCVNPSFETGVANWATTNATLTQSGAYYVFGSKCGYVLANGGMGNHWCWTVAGVTVAAEKYTISAYLYPGSTTWAFLGDGGDAAWHGKWFNLTGAGTLGTTHGNIDNATIRRMGDGWYHCTVSYTAINNATTTIYVWPAPADNTQAYVPAGAPESIYVDGVQRECQDHATTYCDGSLGTGYSWTGVAHASSSARAVTEVNLDAYAGLISSNDTLSFRIVAQMPYDATTTWPEVTYNVFSDMFDGANPKRISLYYDSTNDQFRVFIHGNDRLIGSVQTFKAGAWIDLVVTIDFGGNEYKLYVNGVLDDTDTTALAAQTCVDWNLGSDNAGATHANITVSEYAVFDRVLTAAEVAQMYNLQRPLVDAGAIDSPGIYIYDGRFRIASSTTGNRIEIIPDEIAGYNSAGVKQFYLQSGDGKAYCGGGKVWLDTAGVNITIAAAPGWILFSDAGTTRGSIVAYNPASPLVYLNSGPAAAAGNWAEAYLRGNANNATVAYVCARRTNVSGQILLVPGAGGSCTVGLNAAGQGYLYTSGFLSLNDGIAAPATTGGRAHLYVDSADGDLKVKFGDGVVRVLAND